MWTQKKESFLYIVIDNKKSIINISKYIYIYIYIYIY